MKRTIQALIVTSLLLVGCANSTVTTIPASAPVSDTMTTREISEVRENLGGICNAILEYGLPLDREIRLYVRGRIDPVSSLARAGSPAESRTMVAARKTLDFLAGEYSKCDPVLARELKLATPA